MLAQSLSTIIYYKALELRRRYQGRRLLHVQDLSTKPNDTADYVISQRDSAIIPTVSDSSYTSGVLQKHVLYGWSNMYCTVSFFCMYGIHTFFSYRTCIG